MSALSERFRSLPNNSLSLIGTSQYYLLEANRSGYFEFSKSHPLNKFYNLDFEDIDDSLSPAYYYANHVAQYTSDIPFILLSLKPRPGRFDGALALPLKIDKVILSLDIEKRDYAEIRRGLITQMEDNIGKIQIATRRSSKPQLLHQV